MSWLFLLLASLCEIGFTFFLQLHKLENTWRNKSGIIITAIMTLLFLEKAIREIPVGTAYAIWTGIGVIGTFGIETLIFKQDITTPKTVFITLLVVSLIGLKLQLK